MMLKSNTRKIIATSNEFNLVQQTNARGSSLCLLGPGGKLIGANDVPTELFQYIATGCDSIVYKFGETAVKVYWQAEWIKERRGIDCKESVEKLKQYQTILKKMATVTKNKVLLKNTAYGNVKVEIVPIDSICEEIDAELATVLKTLSYECQYLPSCIRTMSFAGMPVCTQEYATGKHTAWEFTECHPLIEQLEHFIRHQIRKHDEKGTFEKIYPINLCNVRAVQTQNEMTFVVTDPLTVVLDMPS
ncbi:hypothetical protein KO465_01810 [Candidatus Micrarchaeota archaeon]|nr:hypothetical protein [Candidatus Micrarchaeota archaeon]